MWRNKQYDAETDGNISLQTADTLQRRAAKDASCAPNLPGAYTYSSVFFMKMKRTILEISIKYSGTEDLVSKEKIIPRRIILLFYELANAFKL